MDSLKLEKWRKNFEEKISAVEIEADALFLNKKLNEYYKIGLDRESQNLFIEISDDKDLPKDVKERLLNIFLESKPEDSI